MSTAELRKRLIDRISKTNDPAILEEVYRLLDLDTSELDVYSLTDEQKSVIEEAQGEIKAGKYITDGEVNKDIDEWLGK